MPVRPGPNLFDETSAADDALSFSKCTATERKFRLRFKRRLRE